MGTVNSQSPVVVPATTASARKAHKAELATKTAELCEKYSLDPKWIGKCGANGLAKLEVFFGKAQIEDKAGFCSTNSATDVIETLLPQLLAAEAETKEVPAASETKTPARVVLTCQCRDCAENPRRALKGYEGQFRFPKPWRAQEILGRPATLEDLPRLAVHATHDFVEFTAGEHVWYLVAKKAMEERAAYNAEKEAATQHLSNRNYLYAGEKGYWVKIGESNNRTVCLVTEALVPEKRYLVGKSRETISPILMARFAVAVWNDEAIRHFRRLGVELVRLDVVLGLEFGGSFPQFANN